MLPSRRVPSPPLGMRGWPLAQPCPALLTSPPGYCHILSISEAESPLVQSCHDRSPALQKPHRIFPDRTDTALLRPPKAHLQASWPRPSGAGLLSLQLHSSPDTLICSHTEAHPASAKLLPSAQMCPAPAHFVHPKVPASLPEAPPSAPAPGSPPDLPGLRIREPPLAGRLLS